MQQKRGQAFSIGIIVILCAILLLVAHVIAQDNSTLPDLKGWSFADSDSEIIKHADIYSVSKVVGKLHVLFRKEGIEAVKDAAPALIYRANELQKIPSEETSGEIYDEVLGKII